MEPIASAEPLRPGDVVHHPAFGFATIAEVDDRGAQLRWPKDSPNPPTRVSRHVLVTSYRRCRAGGLLARHLDDPGRARRLGTDDPVALLGLLLLDLGGPLPVDDVRDWMVQVVGEQNFDGWWSAVLALARLSDKFVFESGSIALAAGVLSTDFRGDGESTTFPPEFEELSPPPAPVAAVRPEVDAGWLWSSAFGIAAELARLHAAGQAALRHEDGAAHTSEGWTLRADQHADSAVGDVAWAARRFLDDAVGFTIPLALSNPELVDVVPAVLPAAPPELLGVLRYALAKSPELRPENGARLYTELRVAHAVWETRRLLPLRPDVELAAGFDTHIGTLKALAGQTNQDSFVLVGEPSHALVAVADGISTASAGSGDLASALTARTLRLQWAGHQNELRTADPRSVHLFLKNALEKANRVVCEAALRLAGGDLSRQVPMGTTVVVGVTQGDVVHLAALGDSRAWIVGRHGVAPLLWDQNLTSVRLRQAAAGPHWTADERGYALVGYLGHFNELVEPALPPVHSLSVRLLPGEWLVLASDGVSDHAADEEAGVYKILEREVAAAASHDARSAMSLARRIVMSANEGTGGDNVTVLALTISAPAHGPGAQEDLAD